MAFQIPFKFSGSASDAVVGGRSRPSKMMDYDQPLVWVTVLLMLFGLVMVYSASIAMPDNPRFARYASTHFFMRHLLGLAIAFVAALLAFQVPVATWERFGGW